VRLLDAEETAADAQGAFGFDIGMLGRRLVSILDAIRREPLLGALPLGLFASGTAAAAALVAAVARPAQVRCVISCAGRPDLAGPLLTKVRVPVLLVVDGGDLESIRANRHALESLARHAGGLVAVPRAPLLRPAGTNALVASLAVPWLADVLFGPNA
jgi:putative phosphoribosyl transferase